MTASTNATVGMYCSNAPTVDMNSGGEVMEPTTSWANVAIVWVCCMGIFGFWYAVVSGNRDMHWLKRGLCGSAFFITAPFSMMLAIALDELLPPDSKWR